MDFRTYFSRDEWDLLRAAPFNVQVLVSQSDDVRELDEIGPLLEILMSYKGDPFVEEVFRDTFEATEETRLMQDPRVALDQVSSAIQLIKNNISSNTLGPDTLDIFCAQLLNIAEQTADADIEGLEAEEDSIINLLKQKFS